MSNKEQIVNRIFNHLTSIKSNIGIENTVQNRFASLGVEEDVVVEKKEEIEEDKTLQALSLISTIYSELRDSYDDDDKIMIADYFKNDENNYAKGSILPFFVDFFERTGLYFKEEMKTKLLYMRIDARRLLVRNL